MANKLLFTPVSITPLIDTEDACFDLNASRPIAKDDLKWRDALLVAHRVNSNYSFFTASRRINIPAPRQSIAHAPACCESPVFAASSLIVCFGHTLTFQFIAPLSSSHFGSWTRTGWTSYSDSSST